MNRPLTSLCLASLLLSCGGRTPGVLEPAPDAGPRDTGPPPTCQEWDLDLSGQNLHDINRLSLAISVAVVEGRLDRTMEWESQRLASLRIDQVWHGPEFLEGFEVWVGMGEDELEAMTLPGDYIIGFRSNPYPTELEDTGEAVWWSKSALIPAEERPSYGSLIGYHSVKTPHVAVVRIQDQGYSTTFEVVEPLQGEFPETFTATWSTSTYPVPFPGPGDTLYLASLTHLTYYEASDSYTGSFGDLREETPESRSLVEQELASPVVLWDRASTEEEAKWYQWGWAFHRAPQVFSTVVSGIAGECCTGAGGTFIAHDITEHLQGPSSPTELVTGGHGYYGPEACGDQYLQAVHGLDGPSGFDPASFACDNTGVVYANGPPPGIMPERLLQLDHTAENRQRVEAWLDSSPPLLRVHAEDEVIRPEALAQDGAAGLWSMPVSVDLAVLAGTHPAWITVDRVVTHPDWTEVFLETTFAMERYDHLTLYRVKLAFQCGDPRLLQEGSDWLGFFLWDPTTYPWTNPDFDLEGAFLIPGVLLPPTTTIRYAINTLEYAD